MNLPRGGEGARFGLGSSCSLDPPAQAATQRATWRGIWPAKKWWISCVNGISRWMHESAVAGRGSAAKMAAWVGWRPQDLLNSVPQACGPHTELHEESVHERCGCTTGWATSKNLVLQIWKVGRSPVLEAHLDGVTDPSHQLHFVLPLGQLTVQFDADWIKDGKSGNSATATWLMILHVRPDWQASANLGST